ncbi:molybdenum cofactor biosynthesis protein MoaE [Thermodesulfatator atlanticus]|uniref:molybdenum cofactor biosynthesis protein MoaE n=1 Tax=Thermodesulfatator atlanticus TaxID=501497 RepID=UPI0003B5D171|nr:molybdenum cofactor biosynthesis protein MoaE [Thermodesulfatator atlanticus]
MVRIVNNKNDLPTLDSLISDIIEKNQGKIGMILTHTGVVRAFTRKGEKTKGVKVTVNKEKLEQIIENAKCLPGISDVRVVIRQGELSVGDILMLLIVAGDFRENVFNALKDTLDQIKTYVTSKQELAKE